MMAGKRKAKKAKRVKAAVKPHLYILVHGKEYPINTRTQVDRARLALFDACYGSARVWRNGESTEHVLYADREKNYL
jgi:hypothetical protein